MLAPGAMQISTLLMTNWLNTAGGVKAFLPESANTPLITCPRRGSSETRTCRKRESDRGRVEIKGVRRHLNADLVGDLVAAIAKDELAEDVAGDGGRAIAEQIHQETEPPIFNGMLEPVGGIMKRVLDCCGMTTPAWKRLSRRHGGLPGPCVYVALRATVKWKV